MIEVTKFKSAFLLRKKSLEDENPSKIVSLEAMLSTVNKAEPAFSAYVVINEEFETISTDLLNRDSLAFLINAEVKMNLYIVDLDREPHEPWEDETVAINFVQYITKETGCSGYVTNAGIRLIFPLEEHINRQTYKEHVTKFNDSFLINYSEILDDLNLKLDDTNKEWDRVYKCPNVNGKKSFCVYNEKQFSVKELLKTDTTDLDENVERPETITMTMAEKTQLLKPHAKKLAKIKEELFPALVQGEVFFSAGTRNKLTYKVVNTLYSLLKVDKGVLSPAVVYSLLYASVSKTQGKTSVEEALTETWEMCVRAYQQKRVEILEVIEKEQKHEALKKSKTYLPPVVFIDRSYLIYNPEDKSYFPPVTTEPGFMNLISSVADKLGIVHRQENKSFISMSELVTKYGKQIAAITYVTNAEEPVLDNETKTLYIPCGRPRTVKAVYHQEIEDWIALLSNKDEKPEDYIAMKDWLATFFMFDRPTVAIYLQGTDGCGKGMLASALASFFSKAPITLEEATGNFNDGLVSMPFVFCDEKATATATVNSDLRRLIGETNHAINKKFHSSSTLVGCIRVLFCSNDEKALPIDRNMTAKSLAATVKKIRYIHCSEKTPEYLTSLGGREYTQGNNWVTTPDKKPGKIAEHIMWLVENWEVDLKGRRFLVQDKRTAWHDRFGISTEAESLVNILFKAIVSNDIDSFINLDIKKKRIAIHVTDFHRAIQRFTTNRIANLEPTLISARLKEIFPSFIEERIYFKGKQKRALIVLLEEVIRAGEACDVDYVQDVKELFEE